MDTGSADLLVTFKAQAQHFANPLQMGRWIGMYLVVL